MPRKHTAHTNPAPMLPNLTADPGYLEMIDFYGGAASVITDPEIGPRAAMVARGELVEVASAINTEAARVFGGATIYPIALTRAAYEDMVRWTYEDIAKLQTNDEEGRLWDVLTMTGVASRAVSEMPLGRIVVGTVYRIPRPIGGKRGRPTRKPQKTHFKIVKHTGDNGETVVTIAAFTENVEAIIGR